MEKVFEALQRLAMPDELHKEECEKLGIDLTEDYETIKQALQRLEAIDNANPSKALNGLEFICKILNEKRIDIKWLFKNEYNTIKATLLKTQEDKQFIELILNKPQLLNVFAFDGIHTWEEFEDTFSDEDKEYINTTKEEYEYMRNQLIKRGKING